MTMRSLPALQGEGQRRDAVVTDLRFAEEDRIPLIASHKLALLRGLRVLGASVLGVLDSLSPTRRPLLQKSIGPFLPLGTHANARDASSRILREGLIDGPVRDTGDQILCFGDGAGAALQ